MTQTIEALLITKGHVFEREPFFQMIDALGYVEEGIEINWTHVEHPAASALFHPERAAEFDVMVFYDMPGVKFGNSNPPFVHYDPNEQYKSDFLDLLAKGKGMVFLHHAIAAWPSWPEFAHILGGRFHFLPGKLGGKHYPGSGFRFKTAQTISVIDPAHPVVEGVESSFSIVDEAYLFPVIEDEVTPLLRSDFQFSANHFHMGGVNFKEHPDGSSLVGWTKKYANSTIVYLQMGHGPEIYRDDNFQKLLFNSVRWASLPANDVNCR